MVSPPPSDQFRITALWRPRGEAPDELAERFIVLTERLAELNPSLGRWFAGRKLRFEVSRTNYRLLSKHIAKNVHKLAGGKPDDSFGYNWHSDNSIASKWNSQNVFLSAAAGHRRSMFFDYVGLETDPYHEADPAILNFEVLKGALLAIAESFDTDEAIVCPTKIIDLWPAHSPAGPRLRPAWMTYVAARFAPLVSTPRSALVEQRPDGSLFMAATTERFSTGHPDHMRVARDIAASAPTFTNVVPDSGKCGQIDVIST